MPKRMKMRAFLKGLTLFTAFFVTFLLLDKGNRYKLLCKLKHLFGPSKSVSYQEHSEELKSKIGNPEPRDERDNNMVWEGSMYSVKYYNEEKDSHDS